MTQRRVEVAQAPAATYNRLVAAVYRIGQVKESDAEKRFVVAKARSGLNPVRLHISVLTGTSPETSIVEIHGRGQDILGGASRKVINRLIAAL